MTRPPARMGIDSNEIPIVTARNDGLKCATSIEESAKRYGQRYAHYESSKHFSPDLLLPQYGPEYFRTDGCSMLMYLIATQTPGIVDRIKTHPEEIHAVSNQGWTALHLACMCAPRYNKAKLVRIVSILLEAGANINAQDAKGFTPLMRVVQMYGVSMDLFNVLMTSMCDVNLKNNEGYTALHLYYRKGDESYTVIQPILDAGFDINSTTLDHKTILIIIVEQHNECDSRKGRIRYRQHIQTVLDRRANIDAQNANGNTALHLARYNAALVRLLLDRGANPNIKNNQDQTPIMRCCQDYKPHRPVITLLLQGGAIDKPERDRCSLL